MYYSKIYLEEHLLIWENSHDVMLSEKRQDIKFLIQYDLYFIFKDVFFLQSACIYLYNYYNHSK